MKLATYTREEALRMEAALGRAMRAERFTKEIPSDGTAHMTKAPRSGRPPVDPSKSKVAIEVKSMLRANGPMTSSQIALEIGRSREATYSRMKRMEELGVVRLDQNARVPVWHLIEA